MPAVGVQLRLATSPFVHESAGAVAADGPLVRGQDLQFYAVEPKIEECPLDHEPGDLPAEANPPSVGHEDAEAEAGSVVPGVDPKPGATDAFAGVLDAPLEVARRPGGTWSHQVVSVVVPPAVPGPAPPAPVAILLVRIDGVAKPVVDVAVGPNTKDDPIAHEGWWIRRHRQRFEHGGSNVTTHEGNAHPNPVADDPMAWASTGSDASGASRTSRLSKPRDRRPRVTIRGRDGSRRGAVAKTSDMSTPPTGPSGPRRLPKKSAR